MIGGRPSLLDVLTTPGPRSPRLQSRDRQGAVPPLLALRSARLPNRDRQGAGHHGVPMALHATQGDESSTSRPSLATPTEPRPKGAVYATDPNISNQRAT